MKKVAVWNGLQRVIDGHGSIERVILMGDRNGHVGANMVKTSDWSLWCV